MKNVEDECAPIVHSPVAESPEVLRPVYDLGLSGSSKAGRQPFHSDDDEIMYETMPLKELIHNYEGSATAALALTKRFKNILVTDVLRQIDEAGVPYTHSPLIFGFLVDIAVRTQELGALRLLFRQLARASDQHFQTARECHPQDDAEIHDILQNVFDLRTGEAMVKMFDVDAPTQFDTWLERRRDFMRNVVLAEVDDDGLASQPHPSPDSYASPNTTTPLGSACSLTMDEPKDTDPVTPKCTCTPFIPSLSTYGALIRGFGSAGDIGVVTWLWNHMHLFATHVPESVTYGCLLDALVQGNEVRRALTVFRRMQKDERTKANTIMYSTLIKGFARIKAHESAIELYHEMVDTGVPVNTVTFNSLVNACARVGAMREAAKVLEEMIQANIHPDLVTFSTVVKGYCIRGEVERAYRLLLSLKEKGVRPDGILYNTLLDGCVRTRKYMLCEQIWESMVLDDIAPSNFTLTIFIKLFGKLGKINKIFELVQDFPARYNFKVNGHVYTCVMSACISNQRFDCIMPMFKKLLALKHPEVPDTKSFETALTGLYKGRNYAQGAEILAFVFGLPNSLAPNDKPAHQVLRDKQLKIGRQCLSNWLEVFMRKKGHAFYREDVEQALHQYLRR